jgi:hypothetical protein
VGGAIGAIIIIMNQQDIVTEFGIFARDWAEQLAGLNGNPTYRPIAQQWAEGKLVGGFDTFVVSNLIWFPIIAIMNWILFGFLTWLFTKIMGGTSDAAGFLGSLSFGAFFSTIGISMLLADQSGQVFAMLPGLGGESGSGSLVSPQTALGVLTIIGIIFTVYGLVLSLMAVNLAPENTVGQTVGVMVFLLVITGGIAYLIMSQAIQPNMSEFVSKVQNIDMSRPGSEMPQ